MYDEESVSGLPQLHAKLTSSLRLDPFVDGVDLVLGEGPMHVTVHDAVAVASAALLMKLVDHLDLFDEVAADTADQVVEVIF